MPNREPPACLSRPCLNGANCTDLANGGYFCSCKPYYTGKNCETNIFHPCRSGPCVNGGKCIELGNCTSQFKCVCPFGFTGARCEVEVKEFVLNVTARETLSALYLDSVQIFNLSNVADWKKVATVRTPITTRLIAVMAGNIHDMCAGILLSERNQYILSSNINWKCYIDASLGWASLTYNDSHWPTAHVVASNGPVVGCPDLEVVKDIHPDAKWIWTTRNIQFDLVVYCRGYIDICKSKPCQNGGICHRSGSQLCACLKGFTGTFCEKVEYTDLSVFAYEKLESVYIDDVKMKTITNGVNKYSLHPLVRQLKFMVIDANQVSDTKKCYGLVGSTGVGPIDLITYKLDWKSEYNTEAGWHRNDFNDTKWVLPDELKMNNESRCTDLKPIPDIRSTARWIWPPKASDRYLVAFFRATTNLCKKQLSICQNQGTCSPSKGPICVCPSTFTGPYCEYKIGVDVPGPEASCPSNF
ncbi:hypothetical protein HELRODRAFT_161680 [Helobdella robusta]|uniref:EGF-like domain-containing protein n=1 Tax=Helobdella robusta TaxID=6412 RepID=T1ERS3_HELRO|nr:hypothetical protein HELRODRAFT_161680 [Helobdella robusta]ESO02414.1 hypothetical protein HELRODRAFT_161680 [Helobdella robusta]